MNPEMNSAQQLSLFPIEMPWPFQRVPNKREATIISEVFGGRLYLQNFLADIFDLYPMPSFWRRSFDPGPFQAIGASISQDGFFYMLEIKTGNIYLFHAFSLFPICKP